MARYAKEIAQACADRMWSQDTASQNLGMKLTQTGPGTAVIEMTVTQIMTNGHGICHGGYIFTLADSAFAFACNSYNQITVAQHCEVTFLKPAHMGDHLTASAIERSKSGRSGLYDVSIANQNGDTIAEFRGLSRTTKGTILPE
ncbi:hydroxyphenylacetyl-CoA thioesterase PaaI [Roseibium denhamense]|uniref:Acyl-CoA thioesterase n=1 Tax=Roseibium denhamense TaxID=76305 RepID=A0ABY1PE06_9HYPH|nr:hydroxyphenylacetyl-CoA thioesterase PaaI [Roseibium denhamense]MTI06131.1 hydroxyphenylacetyl-CoA thioesterase PaaI [Roseibium denhamense]SMP32135.1 acyl-CoA thioesterase [Roseibium denhamense]